MRKIKRRDAALGVHPQKHYLTFMMRGGRMTKMAGVAASFAPSLGMVSTALSTGAVVVGSAIATPSAVQAQVVPGDPQCVVSGTTVTCTGDLSDGIEVDGPPYTNLIVNSVDPAGITPNVNIDGIDFDALNSDITINVDTTGTPGITTTGYVSGIDALLEGNGSIDITSVGTIDAGQYGIYTYIEDGNGNIDVTQTGNVTANTIGIYAYIDDGNGNVTIDVTGDIDAGDEGIDVFIDNGDGNITIDVVGDIRAVGYGIYAYIDEGDGDITVDVQGDIDSNDSGIFAYIDNGDGDVTIDVVGDISSRDEDAIFAYVSNGDGDINIDVMGDLNAYGYGIYAYVEGAGDVNVTVVGDITAENAYGIYSGIDDGGSVTIDVTGDVIAGGRGIEAEANDYENPGDGNITITVVGNVTSYTDYGVYADAERDVDINIMGDINAYEYGVYVESDNGSVDILVDGDITSSNGYGVYVEVDGGGSASIEVTGDIMSLDDGFDTDIDDFTNPGDAGLAFLVGGSITSEEDNGIDADVAGSISIEVRGNISAYYNGIEADSDYSPIDILVGGNVTSTNEYGIFAYTTNSEVSVEVRGDVDAYYDGIYVSADGTYGTGPISITTSGSVTGGDNGIDARQAGTGDLTIFASNPEGTAVVRGESSGIRARHYGGGLIDITADNVYSNTGDGIRANNNAGGTSVSITTFGNVEGDDSGIYAINRGTGGLTIVSQNADGTATATGGDYGVYAENYNGGALSIAVNNATGTSTTGIYANNDALGTTLSIESTGTVTGGYYGIFAYNLGSGDLTIDARGSDGTGQVTGGYDGIYAYNYNGGALSVSADNVTGTGNIGINAYNDYAGTSLNVVTTGDVYGPFVGIFATNVGPGDLNVTASNANRTATTSGYGGIVALNRNGGAINIVADNTEGQLDAIYANNDPTGSSISITSLGTATSETYGIRGYNYGSGDFNVTAQNPDGTAQVTGGVNGIDVFNYNGGALNVAADNVTGTTNDAISAYNDVYGTSLSVSVTGTVIGGDEGIEATNYGLGDLIIAATNANRTAQVTGFDKGIDALNYNGGALSVTADNVTATDEEDAIYARNDEYGTSLSVTTYGTIQGARDGINARNDGTGDLTITVENTNGTGQVIGGNFGIFAEKDNGGRTTFFDDYAVEPRNNIGAYYVFGGSLSVTTSGDVTGGVAGIQARNFDSGDLTVAATNPEGTVQVRGDSFGILVSNFEGGSISVTADNVTANGTAINASNGYTGASVSVTTYGTVTGGYAGIRANTDGYGPLSVTAQNPDGTAQVSGGVTGILVEAFSTDVPIRVAVNNVTGTVGDAIRIRRSDYYYLPEYRSQELSVTVTGTVVGGEEGIDVSDPAMGEVVIRATNANGTAQVTGGYTGISVGKYRGPVNIFADNVTGESGQAIDVFHRNGELTSVSTYGVVTGAENGIRVLQYDGGQVSVTVSGRTTGTAGSGIYAYTGAGRRSVITLNDGADVSGGMYAILNGPGDSASYFNDGSTVSGVTQLGLGSDTLTIANATITGVTVLDGGDDSSAADGFVDVLTFSGFNGSFGADLLNWEEAVFDNSDATFTGAAISIPTVALQNNTTFRPSQTGFMLNGDLSLDGSSTFDAGLGGAGDVMLNGNVDNDGTISLVDDTVGDRVTINGDLSGTGTLALDADLPTSTADRVSINGAASGPGGISVNPIGGATTPEVITLVDVSGATSADAFSLASANFTQPGGGDVQVVGAFAYRLDFEAGPSEFVFTPFDENGNVQFNPVTAVLEAFPQQLTLLNTPGSTFQSWGNRPDVGGGAGGAVARNLFDFTPTPENAIWFSLTGTRAEYQGQSTLNADVDTDVSGFEMGVDFPVFEGASGRLLAGASFALQEANTDIIAGPNTASIDTNGNALTLSVLWLSDSLFYANGQLRYSSFSSDMSVGGFGPVALGTPGEGVAASIEIGQAYAVTERLTLVPQFQLVHSDVSGNGIADPFGGAFVGTITDGETTTARLGVHAERETGGGSIFGAISYIYGFDTDTTVNFAGLPFVTDLDENRIELRAGGQMSIGDNSLLYGGLTMQGGLSDLGGDNSYALTGGVRVRF